MISEKLREKKEASGLTTQQIADRCHVPASTVSRILSGQTESPGFQTVYDIAHCLGCSLGDLDDQAPEKKDQTAVVELYAKELENKNKWIGRLTLICCVLVAVLIWILYDAMHGGFGAIRY